MDSAGLPPTSNDTTENPDLLGKRAELQTTPALTRDGQHGSSTDGSIRSDTGKDRIRNEPHLQITDWTIFSQNEDSLKHSKDKTGGSTESVSTLTSSQSLLPLEWKTRSCHSQGTVTQFSDESLESTDGENKPDSKHDVVEDVIEDKADFKVCSRMFNENLNVTYSVDSRTNCIIHPGAPNPNDTNNPQQSSDGAQSMFVTCSRTEKFSEFGTPVNQVQDSGADQEDASLIDQLWATVTLSKSLYNINTAPTGSGSNSNDHEPLWSPVLSPPLLKSSNDQREKFNQPVKIAQTEYQPFCQEDVYNQQWSVPNMSLTDCNFSVILQQQIVILKCQIRDLQEAKETAVSELAKAQGEISQLKVEMAQLKTEYLQKLINSEEENCVLKRKENIPSMSNVRHGYSYIQPITSHFLTEEFSPINRLENGHGPIDTYKKALHEEICQLRNESRGLREISHQLNEENHRLKEQLWDVKRQCELLKHTAADKQEEKQEHSRNSASPSSVNSEFTEMLLTGYYDTAKENRVLRDNVPEHAKVRNNSNNFSCIDQHNQTNQDPTDQFMSRSVAKSISGMDISAKFSPAKAPIDTRTLSRRPFAPRSVSDLKIGNLVKFSCSKGKISKGTVKYLGPLIGRQEDYIGIELEGNQEGRHDGIYQGTRYFLCARNKGVFVNFSKIIVAWE